MRELSFLLLTVVTFIQCQDREDFFSATLHEIMVKQDEILENLKELHRELEHVKGQQVLESSLHRKISGVVSLLERGIKDECSEGSHNCQSDDLCRDTLFGFTCSCPPGFVSNGLDCVDIDECTQGTSDCSIHAECTNSIGSYRCSCNPSLEGDGRVCLCPPGFALDGVACEDIDECVQEETACLPGASCTNSLGSYSCSCNPPLEGDGRTSCEFNCKSPAEVISGLGCIKVVEKENSWEGMRDLCRESGGRLLQDLGKESLLHIERIFANFSVGWIGVYDGNWLSSSELSSVPEELWQESYLMDPFRRCGILRWNSSSSAFKVNQFGCFFGLPGICQFIV